jgi:hypothetical protein
MSLVERLLAIAAFICLHSGCQQRIPCTRHEEQEGHTRQDRTNSTAVGMSMLDQSSSIEQMLNAQYVILKSYSSEVGYSLKL